MNMHTIPLIDFRKLADAQEHYAARGFTEVSVPWIVQYEAYNATRPPNAMEFYTLGGYLNASGEQGFIEMMLAGIPLRRNMSVTACFRQEPVLDRLHHRYFMKLELIDTAATDDSLFAIISDARAFLERYLPTAVVRTDGAGKAFDIVARENGTELGSYGIREFKGLRWTYGTGVALPRLDTVLNDTSNHVSDAR